MPVVVVLSGFVFNVLNAYINARFISHLGSYGPGWLTDPRFVAGIAISLGGFALNIHSDDILLRLRKHGAPCAKRYSWIYERQIRPPGPSVAVRAEAHLRCRGVSSVRRLPPALLRHPHLDKELANALLDS